jgi:putative nucleotidyltransferase with HDIG domain
MRAAATERPHDPLYGRGEVTIDEADLPPDAEALLAEVQETLRSPRYQPPMLPRVATEVLAMAQDPNFAVDKMVQVLGTDPVLAGRVLARVGSASMSGGRAPVRSLREAVTRLGMKLIRDLVLEAAMTMRVFRSPVYQGAMEAVRAHSVFVAELSRKVCQYTAVDAEYAFLAGLLHDVGVAGALLVATERGRKLEPTVLWCALDRVHGEASETMARLWSFPAELTMVLRAHHEVEIGGYAHPLAAALAVADAMATERGRGAADGAGDRTAARRLDKARAALGFDARIAALIDKEAQKLLAG